VALSDPKKSKIKDEFKGENIFEALEDGGFNLPTFKYQEKSTLVVEGLEPINFSMIEAPKVNLSCNNPRSRGDGKIQRIYK
jgi:hypothetical protein